jgi:hypothetical protein
MHILQTVNSQHKHLAYTTCNRLQHALFSTSNSLQLCTPRHDEFSSKPSTFLKMHKLNMGPSSIADITAASLHVYVATAVGKHTPPFKQLPQLTSLSFAGAWRGLPL